MLESDSENTSRIQVLGYFDFQVAIDWLAHHVVEDVQAPAVGHAWGGKGRQGNRRNVSDQHQPCPYTRHGGSHCNDRGTRSRMCIAKVARTDYAAVHAEFRGVFNHLVHARDKRLAAVHTEALLSPVPSNQGSRMNTSRAHVNHRV